MGYKSHREEGEKAMGNSKYEGLSLHAKDNLSLVRATQIILQMKNTQRNRETNKTGLSHVQHQVWLLLFHQSVLLIFTIMRFLKKVTRSSLREEEFIEAHSLRNNSLVKAWRQERKAPHLSL